MVGRIKIIKLMESQEFGGSIFTEIVNGLQFSFILNDSYLTRGVQVGLINRSQSLTGVQFGLWNINQKRKFPIINWNFKKNEF